MATGTHPGAESSCTSMRSTHFLESPEPWHIRADTEIARLQKRSESKLTSHLNAVTFPYAAISKKRLLHQLAELYHLVYPSRSGNESNGFPMESFDIMSMNHGPGRNGFSMETSLIQVSLLRLFSHPRPFLSSPSLSSPFLSSSLLLSLHPSASTLD